MLALIWNLFFTIYWIVLPSTAAYPPSVYDGNKRRDRKLEVGNYTCAVATAAAI